MADSKSSAPDEKAGLLVDLIREGQLVWKLLGDPRVGTAAKVVLPVLAALYFLSPVDLFPDFIPVLGQMDDLAIIALAIKLFVSMAPPQVVAEHREEIRHGGQPRQPQASEDEAVDAQYRVVD